MGKVGDLLVPFSAILPVVPPTSDQVLLLQVDNVPTGKALGLTDLCIVPTAIEAIAPTYLYRYRNGGQYAEAPASA